MNDLIEQCERAYGPTWGGDAVLRMTAEEIDMICDADAMRDVPEDMLRRVTFTGARPC